LKEGHHLHFTGQIFSNNRLKGPSIMNTQHNNDTISKFLNHPSRSGTVHLEKSQSKICVTTPYKFVKYAKDKSMEKSPQHIFCSLTTPYLTHALILALTFMPYIFANANVRSYVSE
jgi:hypothetical protein